ncbi:MFS transporter [Agromyces sp. NPDC056965]|uniref:MFS transporter n=1 Tax=Agromyces sp. NPDC056965 TaxID=3345983 RepID=UPI003641AF35
MSTQPPAAGDPAILVAPTGAISATGPVPGEPPQSPPATRRLLPSIAITSLVLFATYSGLISILLPLQVGRIDPDAKVANLAIVSTVSFVFVLFAQPLVGAFSDRTRSKLGRRAPWMIIGAAIGAIFLTGLGSLTSIAWICIFWVVIQFSLNALQGPLTAIVPDRFPRDRRGIASSMMGIGTMLGGVAGVILAGTFADSVGVGYTVFGITVLVVALLFVLFNRDFSSKDAVVAPWSWKAFFSGFWINPRKHPDFAWAFAARFLFILGYFVIFAFQLYLLTDYIGLTEKEAVDTTVLLSIAGAVTTLIAIAFSGWLSDRLGRRKVFIYAASGIMVVGLAFPLIMPNVTGMLIMGLINGFGFGLYMACDTALMTEVLPGGGSAAGKDLGILNVATNIPQAMSPAVAGILIGSLGGYPALFVFGMICVILAGVALIPIKSVR